MVHVYLDCRVDCYCLGISIRAVWGGGLGLSFISESAQDVAAMYALLLYVPVSLIVIVITSIIVHFRKQK